MKNRTEHLTKKRTTHLSKTSPKKHWSKEVGQHSHALELEANIFQSTDPLRIATSLKHSAETSQQRKGTPLQSAMSMLNFYINRAGKNLSDEKRVTLEQAKDQLRRLFGRS